MRLIIILLISMILISEKTVQGDFFADKKEIVHDLLQAAMATSENKNQYIDDGLDGFPVFGFRPGSEVKQPYRLYLPEKLPAEFTLVATFKPMSLRTSYLFAVLNPFETVVQLGIRISDGSASNQNISLVYTNSDQHSHSEEIAKFTVPKLSKKWSKIVIKVSTSDVTLYLNCHEMARHRVTRLPQELVFDTASTLYIAQAGPHIQEKYDGLVQSLKLYPGHPQDLVRCTTDFELFPIELGSGDYSSTPSLDDSTSIWGDDGSGGFIDFDKFGQEDKDEMDKSDINPSISPPNSIAKGDKGDKGDRGPPGPPGPIVLDDNHQQQQGWPMKSNENDDDDYTERDRSAASSSGSVEPGSCICNTTALLASFTMPKIIEGQKGEPGLPGKEGKPGRMGLTGAAGPPGERGRTGAIGPQGTQGQKGAIGPEGIQGQKGTDGIPGVKGEKGVPGPPGKSEFSVHDDGITMRPGLPGPPGIPGSGSKGEPGIPGDKGAKGDTGSKGVAGYGKEGPRGIQGFKGEPGAPGIAGIAGLPGENGRPAEKGDKGDIGPEGKPGPPGSPGLLSRVENDNVNPGASGVFMEKGDKGEVGSRGEKGDLGPKGEKGDRGETGAAGIPGMNGINGPLGDKGEPGKDGTGGAKGSKGERGPPGETVFSGSGDYIAVKGEKGVEGKRGRRGRPGPPGPVGPPGKSGFNGEIGLPGWPNSFKGRSGNPGDRGVAGPKGEKGEPGVPTLSQVYTPVAGPPGPPGNPGPPGLSLIGEKGEPGIGTSRIFEAERDYYARQGAAGSGLSKIVPGAVTFENTEAMTKMSSASPVGTLAYIIDEEALLVRVNNGWQYIALGSLLPITPPAIPKTVPPTPSPNHHHHHHHPLEAFNLINQISMKAGGTGLRMAALNEPLTGDMHGVRGADYACYRQSKRAGLKGTFRAFLSSRVQNVDSIVRLGDRDLPIVNIKGDVLFNSWKDMFDGNGAYLSQNRIYTFNGKNILSDLSWPEKVVWHGSHKLGDRAIDTYCDAWHSGSSDRYGLGSSLTGGKLLEQIRYSCDNKFALLCIEVAASGEAARRKRKSLTLTDEYLETMDENVQFHTEDDYMKHLDKLMTM